MDSKRFIEICKQEISNYYKKKIKKEVKKDEIYFVWSCKTLQNNKALLSTNEPDTRYFEITYNGDKDELYFDCYVKEKNYKFEVE